MTTTRADPQGYGRMHRKEDRRFVRGLGRFCDDIVLPRMLHLAVLWEGGKRRLDVVFAGLEIRDHGEAAEQAAAADREARLAPSLHGR